MNGDSIHSQITPEIEARIVALLQGEASDLEGEQLQQLIDASPELIAFKARLAAVHTLLCEVGVDEWVADGSGWKLPEQQRDLLLATIDGEVSEQVALQPSSKLASTKIDTVPRSIEKRSFWAFSKVAAGLAVAGCIGILAIGGFLFLDVSTNSYQAFQFADRERADSYTIDSSRELFRKGLTVPEMNGDSDSDVAVELSILQSPDRNNPESLKERLPEMKSALLADGDNLDGVQALASSGYLQDDVRYLPPNAPQALPPLEQTLSYRQEPANGPQTSNTDKHTWQMPSGSLPAPSSGMVAGQKADDQTDLSRRSSSQNGQSSSPERYLFSESDAAKPYSDFGQVPPFDPIVNRGSSTSQSGAGKDMPAGDLSQVKSLSDLVPSVDDQPSITQKAESDVKEWQDLESRDKRLEEPANGRGGLAASKQNEFANLLGVDGTLGNLPEPWKKKQASLGFPVESSTAENVHSTFSLHVSDVSFKLARAALAQGLWPEAEKVRIEEFVNAFDYGDPLPSSGEKVACQLEQAIHPFVQQRNVMRIALRTASSGRASSVPLHLTFLIDNSGSMERTDRRQMVHRAFGLLAEQLTASDQITLISFSRQPRLLADRVNGKQAQQLVDLIEELPSEGGTNIEAALQLAFEKAREQQLEGAQNRVVLLTDGAVNLGDANPQSLSRRVLEMRDAGIAFDAAGISADGLNDQVLETLTRQGDGRYYLLDSMDAVEDGFVRQIAGALRPSAKNVKVQIEFNPNRVGHYRLLGFEKHLLKAEDFRDDAVDAAEMAAAEAGVAVYQFEAKPDGEGDIGSVSVRFRDLSTGRMIENRWPILYEPNPVRLEQADPPLRIATAAALLAAKLRGEPLGETVELKYLTDLVSSLPDRFRTAQRIQQLQQMIEQARQISEP